MNNEQPIPEIQCTNCGAAVIGKFCPDCGQKRFTSESLSLKTFFNETAKEFLSIDNKFFRSILPLLLRPGALTQAYISGRQKQYIKPISLFVFVNLFFFFAGYRMGLMNWNVAMSESAQQMISARAAERGADPKEFTLQLNDTFKNYQRSLFFAVIPAFALVVNLVMFRKRRSYVEHLIYSIHYHSSFLIMLPLSMVAVLFLFGIVDKLIGTRIAPYIGSDPGLGYFAILLMFTYHFIAVKRLYGDGLFTAAAEALIFCFASFMIMIPLGQKLLFWLVWYTAA